MKIVFDSRFTADYSRIIRLQPHIRDEIRALIDAIEDLEHVPSGYNPHLLVIPRATYTGYWELHLQEGRFDVLIHYSQHPDKQVIRFIRIGSHHDLFTGPEL